MLSLLISSLEQQLEEYILDYAYTRISVTPDEFINQYRKQKRIIELHQTCLNYILPGNYVIEIGIGLIFNFPVIKK